MKIVLFGCFEQTGVDYYIVPSLYKRDQPGEFYLSVYCDAPFDLEGNVRLQIEQAPMAVGGGGAPAATAAAGAGAGAHTQPTSSSAGAGVAPLPQPPAAAGAATPNSHAKALSTLTVAQFLEKKETLREKIVAECTRLNVSVAALTAIFASEPSNQLTPSKFKKRMMDLGFKLADLADEDMVVLDLDGSGFIEK